MKKQKAMELVKALRSGEYSQGTSVLVDDNDNFCCLGVACNISNGDLNWEFNNRDINWGMGGWDCYFLPNLIKEEFGFYNEKGGRRDNQPIIINKQHYQNLTHANDSGCTFDEIADYIEEHYKTL